MEQSLSWEADRFSASQILCILWNPKVHYRIHKYPPPVPTWASSIQSVPPHLNSWRSTLILSSLLRLGLPSGLFPSGFLTKILYTPFFSPICFDFIHIWIFRCKKAAATKPIVENAVLQFPFPFNSTRCDLKLHGHTVHQRYQMLYCPTNALKYIKSLNC